ncbi:hypothetical protein EW145_g1333 [Phellinidium pouzarii]|uniref:Protein kinase domain-containing protein n=1 Tax=Phellinidium pouzarii TaxID=167371 RepID=A0A4S4LEX5_9AGAM|nr:hypothetical protein EW145_g1333 [Phellinidium pouzarii]
MDHSVLPIISGHNSPSAKRTPTGTLRDFLARLAHLELTGKIHGISPEMKDVGGFSDVFVGYCQCSRSPAKEKVAIKRLRVHLRKNEGFQKRLANEIHIWSKLDHDYILPLHGFFFEDDDYPSLVSEWMENGTVLSYLESNPSCDLLQMVVKIAEGLNYLHTKDVVHSDIKPENILISSSGQPRICDFGVSRMLIASNSFNFTLSSSGSLKGTIRYIAIELFMATGQKSCTFSKESDIWAFGMTILALLSGRVPYFNISFDVGVMFAITSGKLPALPEDSRYWSKSQQFLWKLCNRCWHQLPFKRPSMSHIIIALRSFESSATETWTETRTETATPISITHNKVLVGVSQRQPLRMGRAQYPSHGDVAGVNEASLDGDFHTMLLGYSEVGNFQAGHEGTEIWKLRHDSEEDIWGTRESFLTDFVGKPLKQEDTGDQHIDPYESPVFAPSPYPSLLPFSLYHLQPSSWRQARESSEPPPNVNLDRRKRLTLGHDIIRTRSAPAVAPSYLDGQANSSVTKNCHGKRDESLSQPEYFEPTNTKNAERPSKRMKANKRKQRDRAESKPLRRSTRNARRKY